MDDTKDNNLFITLYLDERRKRKKDGLCPLRLRIKYGQKTNYYGTGLNYDPVEYKKIKKGNRLNHSQNNELTIINAVLKRAKNAAKQPFTLERFKRSWYNRGGKVDVYGYMQSYIDHQNARKSFSSADSFKNALRSLRNHHKKASLPFGDVTPAFLEAFSVWMQSDNKKSLTTVSIYIRCIRTIFNQAIRNGDTTNYPFRSKLRNHAGYKIPAPKKGKIPISDDDLEKIKAYEPTQSEQFWYDMFMFSYYAGGVNLKDIAKLENKNYNNNSISFVRSKTELSNPEQAPNPINDPARQIIKKWNTNGKYIFPLIAEGMSPEEIHKTVKSKTRNINKVIKNIAKKLNIITPISFMTARHTFANKLARSGAPVLLIQQSLHHTSISTTQNYLARFPDKEKQVWFDTL